MHSRHFIIVLLTLSVAACGSLGRRAPRSVDLTGIWDLNAPHSQSPRLLRSAETRERRPHRRFGEPAGPRMPSGPGGIGQGPGGGFPLARGGARAPLGGEGQGLGRLGAAELDIEQRSDSTRIEYDRKEMRIYRWGERNHAPGEAVSGWRDGNFVIEINGRGAGLERTFKLSADRKTLTVITRLGHRSITQRYDLNAAVTAKVYGTR